MNRKLVEIHNHCIAGNIPFAAWQLPETSDCSTIIARQAKEYNRPDLKQLKGFIAAPFNFLSNKRLWVFPGRYYFSDNDFDIHKLDEIKSEITARRVEKELTGTSFESYKRHFTHLHGLLSKNRLEKLVLSRIKTTTKINRQNASEFFQHLRQVYPHAMVYIFNLPGIGLWLGATPEAFLRYENGYYVTQAVAGTRSLDAGRSKWSEKEVKEQQLVTDYINETLYKNEIREYSKKGPSNYQAGNLLHIKTDFSIPASNIEPKLNQFLHDLHPTPAVCGIPKKRAYHNILRIEEHKREFYAGFLGIAGLDEKMQLFVNLRCMQVFEKYGVLYLGGGLTKDSVLEDEWQETEQKSQTLLTIADKL